MRRLWLDYQRPDPGRRRSGMLLLAFGMTAALLTFVDYFAVAAERDDAQAKVEGLRRAAAGMAIAAAPGASNEPATAAPPARRWEALFDSLEAAAADSVTLLTLHPGEKEIQIGGEARDFASALDYVQRLQSASALANVRLTQSEVLAEHPRHPVRFSLLADWRGAP